MTDQLSGAQVSPALSRTHQARNPAWNYDETVLLLDLYLRVGRADAGHPAVVETSGVLRRLATERGLRGAETFRNSEGVAMKLKAMAQQDPEWRKLGQKGLRPVQIDAVVWSDLAGDPAALSARKAQIIGDGPWSDKESFPKSSHGPSPSFGWVGGDRQDGDALLYLLKLEGPVSALFDAGRISPSAIVAKVGRSNDVRRRVVQLSAGFPPSCALGWSVMETVLFASAVEAHHAERRILDQVDARGWSLGGEFLMAPEVELLQLIRESQNHAKTNS